jgi:Zn-dependent protease
MQFQTLLLIAPPILLALTFHEYAHAYMAYRYGDDTARQSGRLTLNPLRHLDPLGTIMIFIVHFGWAKPVPVNPNRLRNPKKDMLWISAAGPLANMVLALASGLLIRVLLTIGVTPDRHTAIGLLFFMVIMSLQINLALAIFNILPIAPLDGSKILFALLPVRYEKLIYFLIWPFVDFFRTLFAGI